MLTRTLILTLCLLTAGLSAQIQSPPPSPAAKLETTIGLTDVTLEYSRPGMRDREIFAADGLVPYGEIWRTGANNATKITFSDDVTIAGKEVPAGSYAILSKPDEAQWEVMMFDYEGGNWTSYTDKEPAVTIAVNSEDTGMPVETFTIDVANYSMDGADIIIKWGDKMVALPVVTNAKESVMATIDRIMAGPSMDDYFQAATFLSESGADNDKALEYIRQANGMDDQPRFWMVRREALILNALGRTDEAIQVAKQSKALAEEAGNMDYVRMNEKSIEEWSN